MGGFGVFGKMPALGDFFRFDIDTAFVIAWDAWLQTGLPRVRADLGARWTECYTTAPIWRFTLTAGLAGPQGAQGVVMPSIDRVGRQFPLTLAMALPAGRSAILAHLSAARSFAALELVALDALDDAMTRDRLADRVRAIRPQPMPRAPHCAQGPGIMALRVSDGTDPGYAAAALAAPGGFRSPSVWSAVLDGDTRLMLAEGLPGPRRLRALFDLNADIWSESAPSEGTPS
jgi:type VI secretion system protein ImpM